MKLIYVLLHIVSVKEKSLSVSKNTAQKIREPPQNSEDFGESFSPSHNETTVADSNPLPQSSLKQHEQQQARISSPQASEEYFSVQTGSTDAKIDVGSRSSSQQAAQQQKLQHDLHMYSQLQQKLEYSSSNSNTSVPHNMDADLRLLLENAYRNPPTAAYRNPPSNSGGILENKLLISPSDIVNNSIPLMSQKDGIEKSKSTSSVNTLTNIHREYILVFVFCADNF